MQTMDEVNSQTTVQLEDLINWLNIISSSKDAKQRDIAMHNVNKAISRADGIKLAASKEVRPFLIEGLKSPGSDVESLVFSVLQKCAQVPDYCYAIDDPVIRQLLFDILQEKDTRRAEKAAQILVKTGGHSQGLQILFYSSTLSRLKNMMSVNETVKFRILDMFANISTLSVQAFQLCESNSILNEVVSAIKTEDILERLNAIQLLEKIIQSHEGAAYLEHTGTLRNLSKTLSDTSDPFANLLVPKIVSLFGELGMKGEIEVGFVAKNNVVPSLKVMLNEGTTETQMAVITAIGQIGSSLHGLILLCNSSIFPAFVAYLTVPSDIRICFLHSFAFMLKNTSKIASQKVNEILIELVTKVETRTGTDIMLNVAIPYLKLPFPELRYAVFDLLCGFASHPWGVQQLINYPGFFEYITNRGSEETKIGKEWQYATIEAIVKTATVNPELIEKSKFNELSRYWKQGVFWTRSETAVEVATKEA